MADFSKNMLREALDSYVTRNEQQAARTIEMDEQVDEMYERIKTYLTRLMKVDSSSVDQLVELLLVSKYFERISDHAQNVAEWVLYFIKGRHMSHQHERARQDE
jgi:phosphate transport system protein